MSIGGSPDRNLEKGPKEKPCTNCGGKGFKLVFDDKGRPDKKEDCNRCNGSGRVYEYA